MHEYGSLPRARQDGLLEETVGDELLLYDQNSHTAHCLSPIAASVWRHCDGEHDVAELAALAATSASVVLEALHELREKALLDDDPALMQITLSGESRREAISRVARYGTAAVAGSMIVSATAATPAMASSGEEEKVGCCQCYNSLAGGKTDPCSCAEGTSKECSKICTNLGLSSVTPSWINSTCNKTTGECGVP